MGDFELDGKQELLFDEMRHQKTEPTTLSTAASKGSLNDMVKLDFVCHHEASGGLQREDEIGCTGQGCAHVLFWRICAPKRLLSRESGWFHIYSAVRSQTQHCVVTTVSCKSVHASFSLSMAHVGTWPQVLSKRLQVPAPLIHTGTICDNRHIENRRKEGK